MRRGGASLLSRCVACGGAAATDPVASTSCCARRADVRDEKSAMISTVDFAGALLLTACAMVACSEANDEAGGPGDVAGLGGSGASAAGGGTAQDGTGGGPQSVCVAGTTVACTGENDCSGTLACLDDGSGFGPCECEVNGTAGTGGSSPSGLGGTGPLPGESVYSAPCSVSGVACGEGLSCVAFALPDSDAVGYACSGTCPNGVEDCADPPAGSSAAIGCWQFTTADRCVLVCEYNGQYFDCPAGMSCIRSADGRVGQCIWAT